MILESAGGGWKGRVAREEWKGGLDLLWSVRFCFSSGGTDGSDCASSIGYLS